MITPKGSVPGRAVSAGGALGRGISFRGKVVAVLAILVAACSAFGTEEGEVIEKYADGIKIKIGYDAVGADT